MSMNGIDISHWQDGIDLAQVPYDFVVIKATEGTRMIDNCCDKFYQKAKTLGKCLGVYHYANGGDYRAEADHFLKNVQGYIGEAILVLDWESQGNAQWNKSDNIWCKNWLDYVHEKTRVRPLLYIQKSALSKVAGIGDYGLWVAQYADKNPTGYQNTPWNEGTYACAMRQYSSTGRLSGYSGNLDLDKFYGDELAWNKYAGKGNASKPSVPSGSGNPNPEPAGSTLDLAYDVMVKEIRGDARKSYLGSRYEEVQSFINHIASASTDALAQEVKAGKYGNNPVRKTVLMDRYDEVQGVINGSSGSASSGAVYYTIKPGDTLSGIAAKYGTTYQKIAQINGMANPNKIYAGREIRVK